MFKGLHPLVEELIAAVLAMTLLGVAVALLFWVGTGISPWPYVVLAEIGSCIFGIVLLLATSPMRHR